MRPLVPEHIETLNAYVPGRPIEEVERELGITGIAQLANNENPLGPSPRALAAISRASRNVHFYPDASAFYLLRRLATHLGVPVEQVIAGSGSNELIELLIRTVMGPDDEALLCRGSFMMYRVSLHAHGRRYVEVPMQAGFRYDLAGMARAISPRTRIIFLSNPDNPTGTAFSRSELEAFLPKVPADVFVVLDEAYFEFARWDEYPNGLHYLRDFPNVVVLRTFSKAYGLAGLRVGYGIMQPALVRYLNRTRMPYNLTSLAQVAGVAALDDAEHVQQTLAVTLKGLRYLERELRALGAQVPDSFTNFVFADFGKPAKPIADALLGRGLFARAIPGYGFPNALRISVGLRVHNEALVAALKEIL